MKSNSPLSPQNQPRTVSTPTPSIGSSAGSASSQSSASPAPGLKRVAGAGGAAAAKVTALEAEVTSLKAKLAESESACASKSNALSALEVQHNALRTSYEWQVSANESVKAELEALRKKHAKKVAECKALEEALLCVARTQQQQQQQQQQNEKMKTQPKVEDGDGDGDGEEEVSASDVSGSGSVRSASASADQKEGEMHYRRWKYGEVFRWIASIDGGYFCKYGELYDRLKMLNIDGRCLEKMNEAVVGRIGVAELQDKLYLMQHIHSLVSANRTHNH